MKRLYHIVTRFTRDNEKWLDRCYESILKSNLNYKWYIVGPNLPSNMTKYKNSNFLHFTQKPNWKNLCNFYFDTVKDEGQWVYILDDDNLMHYNFHLADKKIEHETELIIVSQEYEPNKIRIANENNITVQKIDMAQFCVKRSAVGDLRFWEIYRGDGYFIMELYIRCKEYGKKVQIMHEVFSYYNAQHWL
jgi:hypothetical protein